MKNFKRFRKIKKKILIKNLSKFKKKYFFYKFVLKKFLKFIYLFLALLYIIYFIMEILTIIAYLFISLVTFAVYLIFRPLFLAIMYKIKYGDKVIIKFHPITGIIGL